MAPTVAKDGLLDFIKRRIRPNTRAMAKQSLSFSLIKKIHELRLDAFVFKARRPAAGKQYGAVWCLYVKGIYRKSIPHVVDDEQYLTVRQGCAYAGASVSQTD